VKEKFDAYILRQITEWAQALAEGDDPEDLAARLTTDGLSENQVDQFMTLAVEVVDLAESVEDRGLTQGRALQAIMKLGYDTGIADRILEAARLGIRRSREGT